MVNVSQIHRNYGIAPLASTPIVVRMGDVQRFFVVVGQTGDLHDRSPRHLALPLLW